MMMHKNNFFLTCLTAGLLVLLLSCKQKEQGESGSIYPELKKLNSEIDKNPDDAALYLERGRFFHSKQSYENAITDVKKAISLDSLNADYYHFLADCWLDYYNPEEALKTMYRVIAMYPDRVPSLLKTAEIHYIMEEYDKSILTVNEAVRYDAQNSECFFMLGVNFRALKDTIRAINSFQSAVEFNSGLTDAWIYLGELYEAKKDPQALKYYENAIISDPGSPEAKHAKAFYLQHNGREKDALQTYRELILEHNDYAPAFQNAAILYYEMDSLDQAFENANILTGIQPQNHMGFYLRGLVHQKKKNYNAALKDFQSAANLNSKDPEINKSVKEVETIIAQSKK